MENLNDDRSSAVSGPQLNTGEIKLEPEVLRLLRYNYDSLYAKIEATEFMCPELRRLLNHCKYLHETTNESIENLSPKPVMYTLFLLEDALDRKLTLEQYNVRRKELLGNGIPWLAKLGLLLVIVGAVLAAAGLFLAYGMTVAASVAVTSKLCAGGGALIVGGASWCFFGQPEKISRLADDLGPVLYNATSAAPR